MIYIRSVLPITRSWFSRLSAHGSNAEEGTDGKGRATEARPRSPLRFGFRPAICYRLRMNGLCIVLLKLLVPPRSIPWNMHAVCIYCLRFWFRPPQHIHISNVEELYIVCFLAFFRGQGCNRLERAGEGTHGSVLSAPVWTLGRSPVRALAFFFRG